MMQTALNNFVNCWIVTVSS